MRLLYVGVLIKCSLRLFLLRMQERSVAHSTVMLDGKRAVEQALQKEIPNGLNQLFTFSSI